MNDFHLWTQLSVISFNNFFFFFFIQYFFLFIAWEHFILPPCTVTNNIPVGFRICCISCRGVQSLHKKGCLRYDTKLNFMMRLESWRSGVEYFLIAVTPTSTLNSSSSSSSTYWSSIYGSNRCVRILFKFNRSIQKKINSKETTIQKWKYKLAMKAIP